MGSSGPASLPADAGSGGKQALRQLLFVGLLVLALCLPPIVSGVWVEHATAPRVPSWVAGDIDTGLIMEGLRNTKAPQDTLKWWTGPWVGIVPFYRPLTSYLFWLEWRAFGVNELAYLYPTLVLHFAATLMFAGFGWALARHFRHPWPIVAGGLAGAAFSGFYGTPRVTVTSLVYLAWKNQPDSAAAFFAVGALWLYLRSVQGRRGGLWGAMGMYLIACGFKEIAVPLPAICLFLEPDLRVWKSDAWRRVVAMGAAGAAFLLMRFLALHGVGYTYGSNDAAFIRTMISILGPFGGLMLGSWLVPAVAIGTWAVLLAIRQTRRRKHTGSPTHDPMSARTRMAWALGVAAWLGMLGVLGITDIIEDGQREPREFLSLEGWITGLIHFVISAVNNQVHLMVLALILIAFLARQEPKLLRLGFAWVILFMLPLTLSPGRLHRHYLPEGGYCLIAGLGLAWIPVLRVRRDRTGQSPGTAIN